MADDSGEDRESPALTTKEHIARAMLMGMVYNKILGYYVDMNAYPFTRIDAETLEPLTMEDTLRRKRKIQGIMV